MRNFKQPDFIGEFYAWLVVLAQIALHKVSMTRALDTMKSMQLKAFRNQRPCFVERAGIAPQIISG